MTDAVPQFWGLALAFALVSSLPSCRSGCSDGAPGAEANALELLRRVRVPEEATPGWVDVDDEHDVFMVAGLAGPIQVWSEASGGANQAAATLAVQGTLVTAHFSVRDEVFFAREEGGVGVWNWRENRSVFAHEFDTSGLQAAIGAEGRFVAFGGAVLDVDTGREVGGRKPVATQSALAFSRNGARVVSAGFQEPWIAVRDLPGGAVREWIAPDKVRHAALSGTGEFVAASMRDGEVRLWRMPGGEETGSWRGAKESRALAFGPGDAVLLIADPEGVSVVDIATLREKWRAEVDATLWSFDCDGAAFAAGTTDGSVWLWDLSQQALRAHVRLASSSIVAVAVSSSRRRVVAADEKGEAVAWGWR